MQIYSDYKAGRIIYPKSYGLWRCHVKNVERALKRQPLQGEKVQRFAANLKGNYNVVTIDGWILKYLKWNKKRPAPSKRQYERLEQIMIRLAKKRGLKPAEFQAKIWCEIRDSYGKQYRDFETACGDVPI